MLCEASEHQALVLASVCLHAASARVWHVSLCRARCDGQLLD